MKQIKIGTCIQGPRAEEWLPGFLGKGFETFSLNFHMSLEGTDLEQLAGKTEKLLEGRPERISTIGFYCNPIQYPEHRKTLEQVIRTAPSLVKYSGNLQTWRKRTESNWE